MKRMISSLFVAAAVCFTAMAQEDAEKKENVNAPVFEFDAKVHDFGEVPEGPKYEHVFNFTNNGKEPLIISNVRASCGCTTPSWPREPVLPGASSSIKAIYNSKGRPGKFNKSITITSNASTPTTVVYIKGTVKKEEPVGMPEKKPSLLSDPANN